MAHPTSQFAHSLELNIVETMPTAYLASGAHTIRHLIRPCTRIRWIVAACREVASTNNYFSRIVSLSLSPAFAQLAHVTLTHNIPRPAKYARHCANSHSLQPLQMEWWPRVHKVVMSKSYNLRVRRSSLGIGEAELSLNREWIPVKGRTGNCFFLLFRPKSSLKWPI